MERLGKVTNRVLLIRAGIVDCSGEIRLRHSPRFPERALRPATNTPFARLRLPTEPHPEVDQKAATDDIALIGAMLQLRSNDPMVATRVTSLKLRWNRNFPYSVGA